MTFREKINWLLILQGWAMLWVVIGHSSLGVIGEGPAWENALTAFAYSFHMPLFMLVSGWLFMRTRMNAPDATGGKEWTYGEIVRDKSIRLLLPGFVFSLVAFMVKFAFPGEVSRQAGVSFSEIVRCYLYPYDNPLRELWFIATLFWFFVLTPLWKISLRKQWTMWTMLAALTVLHFIPVDCGFLCFDRLCSFAVWFYLGLVLSKLKVVENVVSKYAFVCFIIGVAVWVAGRFLHPFFMKTGGIMFSFALSVIADRYLRRLFFSFRNYTYQIFLMGIFAQFAVKILYRHFSIPYIPAFILCILFGLYVPVLISKIVQAINWKPLSLCMGLKHISK